MATLTAQALINRVLTSLRNSSNAITSIPVTDSYQLLMLEFFNEVKQEVEDAINWRSLWQTFTVTVPAGSYYAAITGSNERSRVVRAPVKGGGMSQAGYAPALMGSDKVVALVFDTTSPTTSGQFPLYEMPLPLLLFNVQNTNQQQVQQPQFFSMGQGNADNGQANTDQMVLYVYPPVNTTRTVTVTMAVPQGDFSASTMADPNGQTDLTVPNYPIIMGLQWMAREERGEELGPSSAYTEEKYREVLDDAVSIENVEQGNNLDLMLL
jgi:hypothetical protein